MKQSDSVRLLDDRPPFLAELMARLGLNGIHCGCGGSLRPGWLNTDKKGFTDSEGNVTEDDRLSLLNGDLYFLQHDAGTPFPVGDQSFDWAYSEHMIEHLTPVEGVAWLREMRRLVRPGGHVRVTTPDLRRYVSGYLDADREFFAEHHRRLVGHSFGEVQRHRFRVGDNADELDDVPDRPAWMFNQIFRFWTHKWIYDFEELAHMAEISGFSRDSIVECAFQQGRAPAVAALDLPFHNDETVYVEIMRA